jgi:hypothetical protein
MSKKYNNRGLFILFGALLALLAFTVIIRIPRGNATLRTSLMDIDTAKVEKIIISQGADLNSGIEFTRESGKWTVQQGKIVSETAKDAVKNIFSELAGIHPQGLAARSKSKWQEYELTDSLATKVKLLDKRNRVLSDIMIGKTNFKQNGNMNAGSGGRAGIMGISYVRLTDEKEIYSTEGFLSFFFKRRFDEWRNKTFLLLSKNDLLSVEFTYPADSSFSLEKKYSKWFTGNVVADSLQVDRYLTSLSNLNGQTIKDDYTPPGDPDFVFSAKGNNLLSVTVKAYRDQASGDIILNSSLNPGVYFQSKKEGIFGKVFVPESWFRRHPDKK